MKLSRNISLVIVSIVLFTIGVMGFASEGKSPSPEGKPGKPEKSAGLDNSFISLKVPMGAPAFSSFPIAIINDEPITIGDFRKEISSMMEERVEGKKEVEINYSEIFDRIVTARMVIREARAMEFSDLKEIKQQVDIYSRRILREILMEREIKGVKPDEKMVEAIYKDIVKEFKISSMLIEKEESAKKIEESIKSGNQFDNVLEKALSDGVARGGSSDNYTKGKDLLPEIGTAISQMEIGAISPLIKTENGFVIFKVEDIRYPEDPIARERSVVEASKIKTGVALRNYSASLIKKYVKIHKKVLSGLDYESSRPGFKKLLKDKRVVAEVNKDKPVRVSELTEKIRQQFHHGIETAIKSKKVNEVIVPTLSEILHKRVLRKEALKEGIDKTEEFNNRVKEYENSLLFGMFLEKVIFPGIKVTDNEAITYYNVHIQDYSSPELIKVDSVAFSKTEDVESALSKMQEGVDFQWVKNNANGRVAEENKEKIGFEGEILTTKSLPEDIQKTLFGAKVGESRLYSRGGKQFILFVERIVPPSVPPYDQKKEFIVRELFREKVKNEMEEWRKKLKAAYEPKIFVTSFGN